MDWNDHDDRAHRRRFSRHPVRLNAKLRIGAAEVSAVTENISPGGTFLNVAVPAATTVVFASIGLPHGRDLLVRAKVCWHRREPPGVGLEFETFLQGLRESDLKEMVR